MGEHDELWPVRCGPSIQMRVLPESVAAPTPLSADAPPLRVLVWLFFQAEDGIRDIGVTGVQTCALPICRVLVGAVAGVDDAAAHPVGQPVRRAGGGVADDDRVAAHRLERERGVLEALALRDARSEERRVGKEWRSRWSPYH